MKKNLMMAIWLPILTTFFVACNKKEAEKETPNNDIVFATADDVSKSVGQAYQQMATVNLWGRNLVVIPSILCDFEGAKWTSNALLETYELWTFNEGSPEIFGMWNDLYAIADKAEITIRGGNKILAQSGSTSESKQIYYAMGEAYALKALAHFYLVNLFAKHYNEATAGQDAGVVLVKDVLYMENKTASRASVKATYDLIHSDLNIALTYLNSDSYGLGGNNSHENSGFYMNPTAVQALKAKVFMYQANFDSVIFYAEQAVNNASYGILNYKTGSGQALIDNYVAMYGNRSTPSKEDLFTLRGNVQIEKNNLNTYYASHGTDTLGTGGRIYKIVMDSAQSKNLPRLTSSDLRYGGSSFTGLLVPDFRTIIIVNPRDMNTYSALYTNKYPDAGHQNNVRIISLPETYCILAEAYCRKGDEANAKKWIAPIAYKNSVYNTEADINPDAGYLLDFIKWETNFESIAEGRRFFDLRRWAVLDKNDASDPVKQINILLSRPNPRFTKALIPQTFDLSKYALPIPPTVVNKLGIPQNTEPKPAMEQY